MSEGHLPVDRLLPLLTEHRQAIQGPAAIASDGDDTLWRGDVGEHLFGRAVAAGVLRPAATPALSNEAYTWGIDGGGDDPNAIAHRLLEAHLAGDYPAPPAYAAMAWAFAGWGVEELDRYCGESLDDFGFEDRVRPWIRPVLAWCAEQDVPFWLVSASPVCIAAAAARRLAIPAERVVAMSPAIVDGVVAPHLDEIATYNMGKPQRLRARTDATLLAGCGDSAFDAALMDGARVAVAVEPKPALVERLKTIDGPIVVVEE